MRYGGERVDVSENIMGKPFADQLRTYDKVLEIVPELGKHGVALGILSNTIEPHAAILRDQRVYEPFGDHVYLSNEIGFRKPDEQAYLYTLDRMQVTDPTSVLYIDDRASNLPPAEKLGMQVLLAENEDQIASALLDLLNP